MTNRETGNRAVDARHGSPFLNADQTARYLQISPRLLRRLRVAGTGPAYRLHSHRVFYHVDDIDAWSYLNIVGAHQP